MHIYLVLSYLYNYFFIQPWHPKKIKLIDQSNSSLIALLMFVFSIEEAF